MSDILFEYKSTSSFGVFSSWTIHRSDLLEMKKKNPKYYMQCKENMIHENMVLNIYNEIIDILNKYNLGVKLEKE